MSQLTNFVSMNFARFELSTFELGPSRPHVRHEDDWGIGRVEGEKRLFLDHEFVNLILVYGWYETGYYAHRDFPGCWITVSASAVKESVWLPPVSASAVLSRHYFMRYGLGFEDVLPVLLRFFIPVYAPDTNKT